MANNKNTSAPKKEKAKDEKKPSGRYDARTWFITVGNPDEKSLAGLIPKEMENLDPEDLCRLVCEQWTDNKPARSAFCSYCISKGGLHHLHILLCDRNKVRFSTVQNFLCKSGHIEAMRGTKDEAEAYIRKEGKYAEKGEAVVACWRIGEIVNNQGARNDYDFIRSCLYDDGMTWKEVCRLKPAFFSPRYMTTIKNMYFDKRAKEAPFKKHVDVYWVCGSYENCGKTGITLDLEKELGQEHIYPTIDYQNGWADSYAGEEVLNLDEYRGQLPYSTLNSILEGYKREVHARNTNVLPLWDSVYITTIFTPEMCYKKMVDAADTSTDPMSQLLSRITEFIYCYKVDRVDGTKKDREGVSCEFYRYHMSGSAYRALCGDKMRRIRELAYLDYKAKYAKEGDFCRDFTEYISSPPAN